MTVHDLHDALNLLPSDLITAADRVRTVPKKTVIHWQRWVSLAAVLALVIGTTLIFERNIGLDDMKQESAVAEAPAAAAPMASRPAEQEVAADEAQPEPPSDVGAPEIPYGEASGEYKAENGLCIDHSHRFAEEKEEDKSAVGYCGNMMTTIFMNGAEYTISGSDSVAVTDILIHLDYDPDTRCRCMAEFTVDTEMLTGIQVSLDQAFARCELGQAALTEQQVTIIREIVNTLQ